MTICVAALYGNGEGVVLVSDQMVTARFPIGYEFEHDETKKILPVTENVYALIAGDVLTGNQIIAQARAQVETSNLKTASTIAEMVRQIYGSVRLATISSMELEPRGLSLADYYGSQQSLLPQITHVIDQALSQADLGVEIIIAGYDGERHTIHTILNPGTVSEASPIGYSAIGSGAPHVIYSLIEAPYKPSLGKEEVERMVEAAKRRSEVAPGVGTSTQMITHPKGEEENDQEPQTENSC